MAQGQGDGSFPPLRIVMQPVSPDRRQGQKHGASGERMAILPLPDPVAGFAPTGKDHRNRWFAPRGLSRGSHPPFFHAAVELVWAEILHGEAAADLFAELHKAMVSF